MKMQERRRKDDADNEKSHPEREREREREREGESNEMGIDCRLFLVSFPSPSFLPLFFCAS